MSSAPFLCHLILEDSKLYLLEYDTRNVSQEL